MELCLVITSSWKGANSITYHIYVYICIYIYVSIYVYMYIYFEMF